MNGISILVCSIDPAKAENLRNNIASTIGEDADFEVLVHDNRDANLPLSTVYNNLAGRAQFDYLLFVHEDVTFSTDGWLAAILPTLREPETGVIGFAGARLMTNAPAGWGGSMKYAVYYVNEKGNLLNINTNKQGSFTEVAAVDGLAMFVRKDVWSRHKFDEKILPGFHCYDIDFSLAVGENHKNYVCASVLVLHNSKGNFDREWMMDTLRCFSLKWNRILPRMASDAHYSDDEIEREREKQYFRFLKKMNSLGARNKDVIRQFFKLPLTFRHVEHIIKLHTTKRLRKLQNS